MAVKKASGSPVLAHVDDAAGKVTLYVEHGDDYLVVGGASLDYATARAFDPNPTSDDSDDEKGGS